MEISPDLFSSALFHLFTQGIFEEHLLPVAAGDTFSPLPTASPCELLIVPNSLWPHQLYPARLLCPWNSPGKNTGVGFHSILPGNFLTQDQSRVSVTVGRFFTIQATREALSQSIAQ